MKELRSKKSYSHREEIKALGGKWNADKKCWMVPDSNFNAALIACGEVVGEDTVAPTRLRLNKHEKDIRVYIESLTDCVEFLKANNSLVGSERDFNQVEFDTCKQGGEETFKRRYGCSFNQALYFAINGWAEGSKKLEASTMKLVEDLMGNMMLDDYYYDVAGQDFDLDRVLVGEPEAWLNTEQYAVKSPAKHTLKILISVEAMGNTGLDAIETRGVAIAGLVLILERMRRGVEIELVSHTRHYNGTTDCGKIETRTCLKKAGQDLDLGKLAFCICNGGYLRQMMFGMEERKGNFRQIENMKDGNYGSSRESGIEDADIYFGSKNGVYSKETCKGWILAELKAQGVELKGEL